ncbi:uncharacterized protein IWZ02DRAFT_106448 [Phyllosticta citriasiana]|uniref:uncharacterized protein n=1 Tax=Phyllosticta citriasiana TaxID=595635 RepID=UPI0030FDE827
MYVCLCMQRGGRQRKRKEACEKNDVSKDETKQPRPRPASWQRSRPAREQQELWEVGKQRRVKNRKEMYYAPSEMRVNVVRRKGGSAIRRRADKGRGKIPGDEREGRVRKRKRSGGSGSRPSGSEDLCDMRSEGCLLCVAETKEGPGIVGGGGETEDVVDLVDEQHVNENGERCSSRAWEYNDGRAQAEAGIHPSTTALQGS